jgi:hypothetical protein
MVRLEELLLLEPGRVVISHWSLFHQSGVTVWPWALPAATQ